MKQNIISEFKTEFKLKKNIAVIKILKEENQVKARRICSKKTEQQL